MEMLHGGISVEAKRVEEAYQGVELERLWNIHKEKKSLEGMMQ